MTIILSDEQWEKFEEIMSAEPRPLSNELKEAAKRLDEEGFIFTINEETK